MSIENKVPMSDFTEVTDIADTARIIGLQDNENVKIPLQSLIAKTLNRVDEDILTRQDINVENGVTGFNPIGEVKQGDKRAVSGDVVRGFFNQYTNDEIELISDNKFTSNTYIPPSFNFYGFGFLYNINDKFNNISFEYFQPSDADVITKIGVRICLNDYNGVELFNSELEVVSIKDKMNKVEFFIDKYISGNVWIEFCSNKSLAFSRGTNGFISPQKVTYNDAPSVDKLDILFFNNPLARPKKLTQDVTNGFNIKFESIIKSLVPIEVKNILIPKNIYAFPNRQLNLFNYNIYGNSELQIKSKVGHSYDDFFRIDKTEASENGILFQDKYKSVNSKILIPNINKGSGANRKIINIGDSNTANAKTNIAIKNIFENDIMNVEFLGTLETNGVKHEGRSGWRIKDYYGAGRMLFKFFVSGIVEIPSIGAQYTLNTGFRVQVVEIDITGGAGYFTASRVTGSVQPSSSGSMTLYSGTGDNTINYSSFEESSASPFFNPSTQKFDFQYYLTSNSYSIGFNDWVFFNIGTNDAFEADINNLDWFINDIDMLEEMVNNILSVSTNCRIGICLTLPCAYEQNAFGVSYQANRSRIDYVNKLYLLQNEMLRRFSNLNSRVDVLATNAFVDSKNNFPTKDLIINSTKTIKIQSNAMHPNNDGINQVGECMSGVIKYFG